MERTSIAHAYAAVHEEGQQGDDEAEQREEDPVLAEPRERVSPEEGEDG